MSIESFHIQVHASNSDSRLMTSLRKICGAELRQCTAPETRAWWFLWL